MTTTAPVTTMYNFIEQEGNLMTTRRMMNMVATFTNWASGAEVPPGSTHRSPNDPFYWNASSGITMSSPVVEYGQPEAVGLVDRRSDCLDEGRMTER